MVRWHLLLSSGSGCSSVTADNELCYTLVLFSSAALVLVKVRVCVCVWTGLDADLLAVLPALSRHPSLKHLHLGKNFNIKNRCGRRRTLPQCACQCACVSLQERVSVPGSAVSLQLPPSQSVCWQQEVTSRSLLSLFPSTGFWTRSCRSWLRSYRRRSV